MLVIETVEDAQALLESLVKEAEANGKGRHSAFLRFAELTGLPRGAASRMWQGMIGAMPPVQNLKGLGPKSVADALAGRIACGVERMNASELDRIGSGFGKTYSTALAYWGALHASKKMFSHIERKLKSRIEFCEREIARLRRDLEAERARAAAAEERLARIREALTLRDTA